MSHISTLQVVYDAIFLVIMSVTMFRNAYSLAAMAASIFTASCICVICVHHVSGRHIAFTSCTQLSHLPQFILFVLGAAMRGHLVRTAIFVPYITSVRTICPAAPCEFLLLSFTTSGGMFYIAFSLLKALLPDFSFCSI
ncbi:MAG: hypothetical protein IPL08_13405 [Saprospiraceae bacterium]|nr:hypothetical protein [Saprospiraceae bacterium]